MRKSSKYGKMPETKNSQWVDLSLSLVGGWGRCGRGGGGHNNPEVYGS